MSLTNAYATVSQVAQEIGLTGNYDNETLETAINAASRQIDGYCGWRFWQDTTAVARTFEPTDTHTLWLCDDPDGDGISTASGLIVKLDVNDTGVYDTTLVETTDFLLYPRNAAVRVPAWPYTEIHLTGVQWFFRRSYYRRALVQVTAKWGWAAVPDDVVKACVAQAVQLYKSKDAPFGIATFGTEGGMRVGSRLNPIAAGLLEPYRKPSVG